MERIQVLMRRMAAGDEEANILIFLPERWSFCETVKKERKKQEELKGFGILPFQCWSPVSVPSLFFFSGRRKET